MGDMILTLPIIKAIKINYPNSNISIVGSNVNAFLCEEVKFLDKIFIFNNNDNLISKLKFIINFRKFSYDLVFNFSQNIETFLLLLIGKSSNKLSLIYLSRYGNSKFSKIFQRLFSKLFSINNLKIDRNEFFKNKLKFHQTEMMYQLVKKKLYIKKPGLFHLIPNKDDLLKVFEKRILIHLSKDG